MDLTEGTLLHERYRIIGKLGQGGMGAVYEALDTSLDTRVAVKTNFSTTQNSINQFLKEAKLLAALRHPNLPRVTDYFVIDKEQYLVMDFVDGHDLNQRLKSQGTFAVNDVITWASKLSDALTYLHQQVPPVIHRDIKPANIKITPQGQLFLVDFGIAKATGTAQETESGASGYTPGFAPPEQYGHGRTGPFSDQFSLAATLYTLLAGVKPVDSIERLMNKSELIPVQELNKKVPVNLADAITKGLALQPSDRFATVSDFQAAILNPSFRLPDAERAVIKDNLTQKSPAKPSLAPVSPKHKPANRKARGWIIGSGIGGIILCLAAIALLVSLVVSQGFPPEFLTKLFETVPSDGITPLVTTEVALGLETKTTEPSLEAITATETIAPIETTQTPIPGEVTLEATQALLFDPVGGSGRLVFASDRMDGVTTQIWTMRVGKDPSGAIISDELVQLTFDEGNKDDPAWSPDGSQIAFSAPGSAANGLDIWVMNADGSGMQNITRFSGDEFDPVWAPDGKRIVFTNHTRTEGSQKILQLFSIAPNGNNRLRISKDFIESQASFSADGNYLVYVIQASGHQYLFIRNRFDSFEVPQKFDVRELFGLLGETADPEFAPDGLSFVYTRLDGDSRRLVWVTFEELDSFGARGMQTIDISDGHWDFDAAWSVDSQWLAFTSSRDAGDLEVYLVTPSGKSPINLTNRLGVDKSPDWLPLP